MFFFSKCFQTCNFSHETYVHSKKESIVSWCCNFKLATHLLLRFSDMAYNLTTFAWVNSNGLSIKNVNNNWAWWWASASYIIGEGLSSTSRKFKVHLEHIIVDLKIWKKLIDVWKSTIELNQPSNVHNYVNTIQNWTTLPPNEVKYQELF